MHAQYSLAVVRLTEHSPQQRVSERENSIRRCLGRWTRGASPVHRFSLSCHCCGNSRAQVQRVKCSSVFPHAHLSGRVLGTSVFLRGGDSEWVMAPRAAPPPLRTNFGAAALWARRCGRGHWPAMVHHFKEEWISCWRDFWLK